MVLDNTVIQSAAGNHVMIASTCLVVNKTVGQATAVTLPPLTFGRIAIVKDGKGDAQTNNITIQAAEAGGTIDGATSYVINENYGAVLLVHNGTEWSVLSVNDWTGGNLSVPGQLIETGIISPAALVGATSDYNPAGLSGASIIRIDPGAGGNNLTGLVGGVNGRRITIINRNITATNDLTVKHDTTSTAANRFYCPQSADMLIHANGGCDFIYDGVTSRWHAVSV
jgi:hypothetical protein